MKVTIDQDKCIGCGLCVSLCPKVFELVNSKSKVKEDCDCEKESCCQDAKESCPVQAIKVK